MAAAVQHRMIAVFKARAKLVIRSILRRDAQIMREFMSLRAPMKLHVGCGDHLVQGWLNGDVAPYWNAIKLDATRRLPFKTGTFDYVFSEHMIEHLSYSQGQVMLSECFRVLKPGGKLRIATPDIGFLFRLYAGASEVEVDYVRWSIERFIGNTGPRRAISVINCFMRAWGHQFIYDPQTLREAMEVAGFVDILPCEIGQSDDPHLAGLENTSRIPIEFFDLETFVLEALKPQAEAP